MAFKLRSPLNDNEPSKSIPYYSAGNESLNSESGALQNQRLKKMGKEKYLKIMVISIQQSISILTQKELYKEEKV